MKLTKLVAVLGLLLILLAVNWSIYKQEQVLAQGKTVLLKLAPVDPRSLMQGDYTVSYTHLTLPTILRV